VAVALGVVPCAIGTDTSGSIRVPAAFCGIAGFRPTCSRVDRAGVLPLAPSLDSVGALATSVADLVALDAALRGAALRSGPDGSVVAEAGLRLVVPPEDAEQGVAEAFAAAVDALEAAGAVVERRPLAALTGARRAFATHGSLVAHEAWRVHRALLDSPDAEALDRRVLRRLREGRALPAAGRAALLRERAPLQAELAAELDGALAMWPTVPHVAPELAPLERDDEHFARTNLRTLTATMPASYLDMPGVALPIGDGEPPASLLVSGPPGADERVLAAALAVERVLSAAPPPR
jgi:aspartyl-tRNA(Asn)/glutamyl-tRNA(Gln) amidotransferase subunit A